MPFACIIDEAIGLSLTVAHGAVGVAELEQLDAREREDPAFRPHFRQLVLFTEDCAVDVSAAQLRHFAERPPTYGRAARHAVVCETRGVGYGLSRVFAALRSGSAGAFEVTLDLDEACAHLELETQVLVELIGAHEALRAALGEATRTDAPRPFDALRAGAGARPARQVPRSEHTTR